MTNLADLPTGFALHSDAAPWTVVAMAEDVPFDRGIAVLVDSVPVAVFRLSPVAEFDEEWHAVSHVDPVAHAPVMARGLIGSSDQNGDLIATIASPLNKLRYALATGIGLDGDSHRLRVFELLVTDGTVLVR